MKSSLLANLVGIKEDVATKTLVFILSKYPKVRCEFTRFLGQSLGQPINADIHYVSQSSGENKERPDIAGFDDEGKEQILCEAKFYAALTESQPGMYLDRIRQNKGIGLVFICPEVRKSSLWSEILSLCEKYSPINGNDFCVNVSDVSMSIITWKEAIDTLYRVAYSEEQELLSDIIQLDRYCKLIDSDAFVPLSADDLDLEFPRKEKRLLRVLDALIEKITGDESIAAQVVKKNPQRGGYLTTLIIRNCWVSILYDCELWFKPSSNPTPFWVSFRTSNSWKDIRQQKELYQYLMTHFSPQIIEEKWDTCFLALDPPLNSTLDQVTAKMEAQLLDYLNRAEEWFENSGKKPQLYM